MTVAALVLSIVAIVVAVASAAYTRRQAIAAEDARAIEAERRHSELAPVLWAEYAPVERTRERQRPGIWLTNNGPLDLDRIVVEMVPAPRGGEAVLKGIYDPRTGDTVANQETGPLRRGDTWTALEVVPLFESVEDQRVQRGGRVSFRCSCEAAGYAPWVVFVEVNVQGGPMVFFV